LDTNWFVTAFALDSATSTAMNDNFWLHFLFDDWELMIAN
jgi:hypothetical protein